VEVAKSYYSCEDMEGVALENEGSSGTVRYIIGCHVIFMNAYYVLLLLLLLLVLIGIRGHSIMS